MEAEANIIDLWRARGRERMARFRAKQKKEKCAGERIREREAALTIIDLRRSCVRECMARRRAKQKQAKRATERRIRECEAEAGNGIDPPTTTTMTRRKGTMVTPTPPTTTTTDIPAPTTMTTSPGVSVTFTPVLNFCQKGGAYWMFEKILKEPFSTNAHIPSPSIQFLQQSSVPKVVGPHEETNKGANEGANEATLEETNNEGANEGANEATHKETNDEGASQRRSQRGHRCDVATINFFPGTGFFRWHNYVSASPKKNSKGEHPQRKVYHSRKSGYYFKNV